jgi:hypothetical protein
VASVRFSFHHCTVKEPTWSALPAQRPLQFCSVGQIQAHFSCALSAANGQMGAHCVHELWMRGELAVHISAAQTQLWKHAAASIPDWLPMTHFEFLPQLYEVAARFNSKASGRANIYLVLLDYSDSRSDPHGIYVGMSRYAPAARFDQHKAGIRAAGSVLKRGLEVVTGPTLHLQYIARAEATAIEEQLAEALRAEGLLVQGGH